jgi:hypothetical protein
MSMEQFWFTAIVFTVIGYIWGLQANRKRMITLVIDSLIADGYLKTKGFGDDQEIIKYNEL